MSLGTFGCTWKATNRRVTFVGTTVVVVVVCRTVTVPGPPGPTGLPRSQPMNIAAAPSAATRRLVSNSLRITLLEGHFKTGHRREPSVETGVLNRRDPAQGQQ